MNLYIKCFAVHMQCACMYACIFMLQLSHLCPVGAPFSWQLCLFTVTPFIFDFMLLVFHRRQVNWTHSREKVLESAYFPKIKFDFWLIPLCQCSENESEVAQSCLTLCDPMDCNLPGNLVHGIFQARVLEWVAVSFSRGSSRPRCQCSRNR